MVSGTSQREQRLTAVVGPAVESAGFDLEAVTVSQAGRRSLVRIVVDGDDGVSLDDVAVVSRAVSDALDADDSVLGAAPYVLEVSSPGTDRPLTEPRHWRRAAGRLVKVAVDDGKPVTGRVVRADDAEVVLAADDVETAYAYERLGKGSVQLEFNRKDAEPEGFLGDADGTEYDAEEGDDQ